MRTHVLSLSIAVLLLFSIMPQTSIAAGEVTTTRGCFTDVPASHPDALAICTFQEQGRVSGVDGIRFLPDAPIRRAEAFKILKGEFDCSMEAGLCDELKSNPFSDLADNHSLKKWVLYFSHKGFIQGYDATHVGPNNYLTEAEAMKIALNYNGEEPLTWPSSGEMYGLPSDSDLIPYVETALWINVLRGDFADLSVGRPMTRGKFTTLQYRIKYLEENNQVFFDDWKNGFVSCHDVKYTGERSEYDMLNSPFAIAHPEFEVYDIGNLCKMEDGNNLVSYAYFEDNQPGQAIVMLNDLNQIMGQTTDFYCQTAGDLAAPQIISIVDETVEFACISGDAGWMLIEKFTLDITNFSTELKSSNSYEFDSPEWMSFAKSLDH